MGGAGSQSKVHEALQDPEQRRLFSLSIETTEASAARKIAPGWANQHKKTWHFAIITQGHAGHAHYWQTKNLFILSMSLPSPPLAKNMYIHHKFGAISFFTVHVDPVTLSEMNAWMCHVNDELARFELIERIVALYEDRDENAIKYVNGDPKVPRVPLKVMVPLYNGRPPALKRLAFPASEREVALKVDGENWDDLARMYVVPEPVAKPKPRPPPLVPVAPIVPGIPRINESSSDQESSLADAVSEPDSVDVGPSSAVPVISEPASAKESSDLHFTQEDSDEIAKRRDIVKRQAEAKNLEAKPRTPKKKAEEEFQLEVKPRSTKKKAEEIKLEAKPRTPKKKADEEFQLEAKPRSTKKKVEEEIKVEKKAKTPKKKAAEEKPKPKPKSTKKKAEEKPKPKSTKKKVVEEFDLEIKVKTPKHDEEEQKLAPRPRSKKKEAPVVVKKEVIVVEEKKAQNKTKKPMKAKKGKQTKQVKKEEEPVARSPVRHIKREDSEELRIIERAVPFREEPKKKPAQKPVAQKQPPRGRKNDDPRRRPNKEILSEDLEDNLPIRSSKQNQRSTASKSAAEKKVPGQRRKESTRLSPFDRLSDSKQTAKKHPITPFVLDITNSSSSSSSSEPAFESPRQVFLQAEDLETIDLDALPSARIEIYENTTTDSF